MDPVDVTGPLVALLRGLDEVFGTPGSKQNQFAAALVVVARFMQDTISIEHANSFFELSSAIANLQTGSVHPWLAPARDVARRDPSQLWRGRASAVVALEALCVARAPIDIKAAARELLRNHAGISRLGGGKLKRQAGVSTLMNWHKEFSAGRVKDVEANDLFSAGRELIQTLTGNAEKLCELAENRARAAVAAAGVFAPRSNTP